MGCKSVIPASRYWNKMADYLTAATRCNRFLRILHFLAVHTDAKELQTYRHIKFCAVFGEWDKA